MFGVLARAQLGTTPGQCAERYGSAISAPSGDHLTYRNNGWDITVIFTDGKAVGESFTKVQRAEIGLEDLNTLLKFAGGNQRWSAPFPDGTGGVELACSQLLANVSKDHATLLIGVRDCVGKERLSATTNATATSSFATDGDTLVTLSGKTYRRARLSRATPDGISIFHEGGVTTIKLTDLPDAWREKFALAVANATPEPTPEVSSEVPTASDLSSGDSGGGLGGGYGSGGMVHVNGYTRKNGTYVHSYSRRR